MNTNYDHKQDTTEENWGSEGGPPIPDKYDIKVWEARIKSDHHEQDSGEVREDSKLKIG